MNNNTKNAFIQVKNIAEQQGSAFADVARNLISEDETELFKFVDILYYFYDLTDNRQFIDFLKVLGDAYGIPLLPEIGMYRTDYEKSYAFIFNFMETFF